MTVSFEKESESHAHLERWRQRWRAWPPGRVLAPSLHIHQSEYATNTQMTSQGGGFEIDGFESPALPPPPTNPPNTTALPHTTLKNGIWKEGMNTKRRQRHLLCFVIVVGGHKNYIPPTISCKLTNLVINNQLPFFLIRSMYPKWWHSLNLKYVYFYYYSDIILYRMVYERHITLLFPSSPSTNCNQTFPFASLLLDLGLLFYTFLYISKNTYKNTVSFISAIFVHD